MHFNHYQIKKRNIKADAVFTPSPILPKSLPITTPFTFPIKNKKQVMLAKDKMHWWNPLGGHMEPKEKWQKALKREAEEEGGVTIQNIKVVGYIKVTKLRDHQDNKYPLVSQLPITISRIQNIQKDWKKKETSARKLVTFPKALKLLKSRTDNLQMYQIFLYILETYFHYNEKK